MTVLTKVGKKKRYNKKEAITKNESFFIKSTPPPQSREGGFLVAGNSSCFGIFQTTIN